MSVKKDKFLRDEDKIIFLLGSHGVTEKTSTELSQALEVISLGLDKSIQSAKISFYRAASEDKDLLVKVSASPAKYAFTGNGFERFKTLQSMEKNLEGANHTFEEFLRLYSRSSTIYPKSLVYIRTIYYDYVINQQNEK